MYKQYTKTFKIEAARKVSNKNPTTTLKEVAENLRVKDFTPLFLNYFLAIGSLTLAVWNPPGSLINASLGFSD